MTKRHKRNKKQAGFVRIDRSETPVPDDYVFVPKGEGMPKLGDEVVTAQGKKGWVVTRHGYKEASVALAKLRQRIDKETEALTILEFVEEWVAGATNEDIANNVEWIVAQYNRVLSLAGPKYIKNNPEFAERVKAMSESARVLKEIKHEQARMIRLANREPVPDVVQQRPLCVRCNKRPQRFDNLCGRCADETGVRPHGKV